MVEVGKAQRIRIGGLDAIEVFGPPGKGKGVGEGRVAVVLHGYGADMRDLAPLWRVLDDASGMRWIFPNGPVQVALGPFYSGSAWFPIDMAALERAMAQGTHRDLSGMAPRELDSSREAVLRVCAEVNRPIGDIVLGGFSQGAMLATDVALHAPHNPASLLLFSGTVLQEALWRPLAAQRAGLRFVQSHGRSDPLLAFEAAQRLHRILLDAGWIGPLIAFDGGHEIPESAVAAAAALVAVGAVATAQAPS